MEIIIIKKNPCAQQDAEAASCQETSGRRRETGGRALRGAMAALKSLNREPRGFTGEIPGSSAPPAAATGAEKPPLSVTCWSSAAREGFKLSGARPVPDPRLANQSSFPSPAPRCLAWVNASVLSEERHKHGENTTRAPWRPRGKSHSAALEANKKKRRS